MKLPKNFVIYAPSISVFLTFLFTMFMTVTSSDSTATGSLPIVLVSALVVVIPASLIPAIIALGLGIKNEDTKAMRKALLGWALSLLFYVIVCCPIGVAVWQIFYRVK